MHLAIHLVFSPASGYSIEFRRPDGVWPTTAPPVNFHGRLAVRLGVIQSYPINHLVSDILQNLPDYAITVLK